MLTVRIDAYNMRLDMEGHAGYAPIGQDIVCAAASTLAYTLAQNLALTLYDDEYEVNMDYGKARIYAFPPASLADRCRDIFMTIANGFVLLAAEYSQYIELKDG